jgi:hypothetical protein
MLVLQNMYSQYNYVMFISSYVKNLSVGLQVTGRAGCDAVGVFENMLRPVTAILTVTNKYAAPFKYRGSILSDQYRLSLFVDSLIAYNVAHSEPTHKHVRIAAGCDKQHWSVKIMTPDNNVP